MSLYFNHSLSKYKTNISLEKAALILIAIATFPLNIIDAPKASLDPSWMISINLGIKHHLIWGKDYVFSYGPLGFLATRRSMYVSKYLIYIFYTICWMNVVFAAKKLLSIIAISPIKIILATIVLFLSFDSLLKTEVTTVLFLSSIFYLIYGLEYNSIIEIILASIIGIVLIFIKINVGIVINFIILIYLIFGIVYENKSKFITLLITHLAAMLVLCCNFKIDLKGYLTSALHVISAYNDAMYNENVNYIIILSSLVILIYLINAILKIRLIINNKKYILYSVTLLLSLFILYKHSFVRHHGLYFFTPPYVIFIFILHFIFIE